MAAATATALIGGGLAAFQAIDGMDQKRKAQNARQDYKRQNLDASNPYENIQISTVGTDIMREESQRNNANAVDALRNGGTRGVAMIPQLVAGQNRQNQEIRAYLDDQVNKRNYAIAGDQTAIRGMKEERENADLAGLGQQMQVGRQDMWSGFRGLGNAAISFSENYKPAENPKVEGLENAIAPVGFTPGFKKSLRPEPKAQALSSMIRNNYTH